MDASEVEKLLAPLSPESPCGPDMEYDGEFGEMERSAQGKGEQQFGSTIVGSEPPEWKVVRKSVQSLLERTKDMRVAVYLARCTLNLDGFSGFQFALQLLRGYVERYWDSVHPGLDHSDDDDPTYRTNTLVALCDDETTLRELRAVPIISSRALGRFNWRDIEQARSTKDTPPSESTGWGSEAADTKSQANSPSMTTITAACSDVAIEDLSATEEATRLAADHVAAIEQHVTLQVGAARSVSLEALRRTLLDIHAFVVSQLERRGVYQDAAPGQIDGPNAGTSNLGEAAFSGKVTTREEAIKALDSVCEFYERNEPSSPLPLLIRRAKRLASKSFLEILRDLAPGAVSQAEALGGADEPSSATEESNSASKW